LQLRVSGLDVETSRQRLSVHCLVRHDRAFDSLLAALNSAPTATKDADYGAGAQ
jgi:hypothetical protein